MRPNLAFLSAASNALLKTGGLLRWNKRLVKDARLSLPLTESMKIARLTSPLLDAPRQSSPRPRLRHGRRLDLLFHLSLTLNLYTLFFTLSLAHLPRLPPLLTSLTVLFKSFILLNFNTKVRFFWLYQRCSNFFLSVCCWLLSTNEFLGVYEIEGIVPADLKQRLRSK